MSVSALVYSTGYCETSSSGIENIKQKSLSLQYNDRQPSSCRMTQTGAWPGNTSNTTGGGAAKITGGGEMKVGQPIEANGRQSQH